MLPQSRQHRLKKKDIPQLLGANHERTTTGGEHGRPRTIFEYHPASDQKSPIDSLPALFEAAPKQGSRSRLRVLRPGRGRP